MDLIAPLSHQMSILAQASTGEAFGPVVSIVSALGGTGFAVWYAWYMTTVYLPRIQAAHAAANERMEARYEAVIERMERNYAAVVKGVTDEFRAEQRETRELFTVSLAVIERNGERAVMAVDRLCDKLGHPGPLSINSGTVNVQSESAIVKGRSRNDSDASMDTVKDKR